MSVIRTDGSGDHPIVRIGGKGLEHPRWSWDDTKLVFDECGTSSRAAKCTIVESNADGTHRHTIYDCGKRCFGGQGPSWSPDGTQVAFGQWFGPVTRPPTFCGLTIVTLGSPARTIARGPCPPKGFGPGAYPRWSPDGKELVFYEERAISKDALGSTPLTDDGSASATAVFTINVDGTGVRQLTPWRMDAGDPDWSPDGKLILFCTHTLHDWNFSNATSNIYTMRPDGTGVTQLTHFTDGSVSRATDPSWTSDGSILYDLDEGGANVISRSIWMMAVDGSAQHEISPEGGLYTRPQAQP